MEKHSGQPDKRMSRNATSDRGIVILPQDHHVLEQLATPNLFQIEHKKNLTLCRTKLVILEIKLKLLRARCH